MRHAIVLIVAALVAAMLTAVSVEAGAESSRIRCLSPGCKELLAVAVSRSPVFRGIVEDLERTDVVVYVELPGTIPAAEPRSWIRFVAAAAGTRYLIVEIDPWRASLAERVALLGHELYHALEIAAAPEVMDADGLRRFYLRVGHQWGTTKYESEQAQVAERLVRADLVMPRASADAGASLATGPTYLDLAGNRRDGWDAAGRGGLVRPRSLGAPGAGSLSYQ